MAALLPGESEDSGMPRFLDSNIWKLQKATYAGTSKWEYGTGLEGLWLDIKPAHPGIVHPEWRLNTLSH